MTRFARAKGSKASNEKTPEDSTPWEVMKEQLLRAKKDSEDAKKREEAENQRIANYENFLKQQKVQKRKPEWCDFPDSASTQISAANIGHNNETSPKKKKKKQTENEMVAKDITASPKEKKKKNKGKNVAAVETQPSNNSAADCNVNAQNKKNKKKRKGKNQNNTELGSESQTITETTDMSLQNDSTAPKNKKKKNKSFNDENHPGKEIQGNQTNPANNQNKMKAQKKKKNKKIDGKPVRRKEINDKSFQLIINGKEVELVRFEGFPVIKKDAERLEELKKNMAKKGIPKSEVQRTIKLERRRAEKALARLKRDVCYNCRKGGHNLSDCPDLKSKIPGVDTAEGVCFKCGSTEHRQFECKVQRNKEFRFATCFICKEPGHIARQCPDNPKGLYPNGGSCKLCGDVTHLRKDCPTVNSQKEETSVKLQTIESSNNLEDIGQVQQMKPSGGDAVKKPKKITF